MLNISYIYIYLVYIIAKIRHINCLSNKIQENHSEITEEEIRPRFCPWMKPSCIVPTVIVLPDSYLFIHFILMWNIGLLFKAKKQGLACVIVMSLSFTISLSDHIFKCSILIANYFFYVTVYIKFCLAKIIWLIKSTTYLTPYVIYIEGLYLYIDWLKKL